MTESAPFLFDSDVFIAAKNAYYAFDICPGFWKSVIHAHTEGRARSIDRIRNELPTGRKEEDLVQWVENALPATFFHDSNSEDISSAYGEVMLWVQRNGQYFDRAKAKFATEADGCRRREEMRPDSISRCCTRCTWTSGWPVSRRCRPCHG
jgi:hypothetical protein